jgi:hypothetical protein
LWSEHILPDALAFVKKLLVQGAFHRYNESGSGEVFLPTLPLPRSGFASGNGQVRETQDMNKY